MSATSTDEYRTLSDLLSPGLGVPKGEALDIQFEGRALTVHATESGTVLTLDGRAVVVRPQPGGRFVVTGALAHHRASEPLSATDALALAVRRLEQLQR